MVGTNSPEILLVNVPYRPVEFSLGLPIVESAFGAIPPINLLMVATAMREAGGRVAVLDGEGEGLSDNELARRIVDANPDVVGLTSTTFSYWQAVGVARRVKEAHDVRILFGGRHAQYYAAEMLNEPAIDLVSIGEMESSVRELLETLAGERDPADCPGLAFRKDGGIAITDAPPPPTDLDALPWPARDLVDNARYFSLLSKWRNFTLVVSSRGCPCECVFCEVGRSAFRARSAANVVAEMDDASRRFGIREFDICDSDFCLDRDRVLEIADRVGGRLHFSGRARVNDLTPAVVEKLARGGCFRIHLGIESAVPSVLQALGKRADLSRLGDVARTARREGLALVAYFMIGNPGETEDDARRTARFARSLPFAFVQFTRTFPLPNSPLYDRHVRQGGADMWRAFYLTGKLERFDRHVDSSLTASWVHRFINRSYLRYYLSPAAAWRVVSYFGPVRFLRTLGLALRMLVSWSSPARKGTDT